MGRGDLGAVDVRKDLQKAVAQTEDETADVDGALVVGRVHLYGHADGGEDAGEPEAVAPAEVGGEDA